MGLFIFVHKKIKNMGLSDYNLGGEQKRRNVDICYIRLG